MGSARGARGARGVAGPRAGGVQGARAAHPASILSSLLGVEEHEEEGDVGPSSAGPQQKLGPSRKISFRRAWRAADRPGRQSGRLDMSCSSTAAVSSTALSQQSPSEGSGGEGKEQRTFLEKHLVDVHPQDIAVPSHDQHRHVELCPRPCLFATCGSGRSYFMAAYLYHVVEEGIQVR